MLEKFPYLTMIYNKKNEIYISCLVQTISKNFVSFYNIQLLKPSDIKKFFKLSNIWWKNSPNIPISLYYQSIFKQFDYCKQYLSNNDYIISSGFEGIKLKNLSEKRIKRKIIHLD